MQGEELKLMAHVSVPNRASPLAETQTEKNEDSESSGICYKPEGEEEGKDA